jgi:hypothetical protein
VAAPPAPPTPWALPADYGPVPPPPRRKGGWIAAGVLAAVAVVVVVLLVLSGILHVGSSSGGASAGTGPVGTPVLYSAAVSSARSAQTSAIDGPWTIEAMEGFGTDDGVSGISGEGDLSISGCTTVWTTSASISAPATPSNATAGELGFWFALSENRTGATLLTIVDDLGSGGVTATNAVILTGGCVSEALEFGPIVSSAVDSSTAVTVADENGGSSFLGGHAGVTTLLLQAGAEWIVIYTTCGLYATGGTGTEWGDTMYAANGTQIAAVGPTPSTC